MPTTPPSPLSGSRAQSETIGVLLLTGVIIVAVGVGSAIFLGESDLTETDGGPLLDAQVTFTSSVFNVTHGGGDTVAVTDLAVVLRGGGTTNRYTLAPGAVDGDDAFEPSERWSHAHGLAGSEAEVLVVHVPSNSVVTHEYADVPPPPENAAPSAALSSNASAAGGGPTFEFDARASADDRAVVSYRWDWDGDGFVDDTTTDPRTTHAFSGRGDRKVVLTVVDADGATDTVSHTVTVGAPGLELDGATLEDDSDGLVAPGDDLIVTATVEEPGPGFDSMTADASPFDAETVTLTDDDGDGTYDATFTVGDSPTEGDQAVTVTGMDRAGNTASATSEPLTVDATPPAIETFGVDDGSDGGFYWVYWDYVESFRIQWAVADERLAETTVTVNRSETTQESYSGASGDETYENTRVYAASGREHSITVVAVDSAGNRACQRVVDTADGDGPPASAYESC